VLLSSVGITGSQQKTQWNAPSSRLRIQNAGPILFSEMITTSVGACLNKEFTPIATFETIGRYIRLEIPTEAFTN